METQFKVSYREASDLLDIINFWISKHGYEAMSEEMKELTRDLIEYTNRICEKYGVEEKK